MDEYIKRSDAVNLAYKYCHDADGREGPDDVVDLWNELKTIPPADPPEKLVARVTLSEDVTNKLMERLLTLCNVVPCALCKHYLPYHPEECVRDDFGWCSSICKVMKRDDFCSRGERREE